MTPFETESYHSQLQGWPTSGKHIMAHYDDESIVVYQAYNPAIADFAVTNQRFGGPFSFSRMSWIKSNFLWMMYRCGWATKENQERVLAVRISRTGFDQLLHQAVHSAFLVSAYPDKDTWQDLVGRGDVRLQWDPDHDPYGAPQQRRAIQLGLRRSMLAAYATDWIIAISDITGFVHDQRTHVQKRNLDKLQLPLEREYSMPPSEARNRLFAN